MQMFKAHHTRTPDFSSSTLYKTLQVFLPFIFFILHHLPPLSLSVHDCLFNHLNIWLSLTMSIIFISLLFLPISQFHIWVAIGLYLPICSKKERNVLSASLNKVLNNSQSFYHFVSSLSHSKPFSLSFSLSFCLSVCLTLSLSLSLYLSLSLSLSLSL